MASNPRLKPLAPTSFLPPPPTRAAARTEFKHLSHHPSDLPSALAQSDQEGWSVIAIVPCHWNDHHVAYLRRTL